MEKVERVIFVPDMRYFVGADKRLRSELTKDMDAYRLEDEDFVERHPTYLYDCGDRMEADGKPGHVYAFRVPGATRGGIYTDEHGHITDITFDEKTCFECIPCYNRQVEAVREKYLGAKVEIPTVRVLLGTDMEQVTAMDEESTFCVADMMDPDVINPNEASYAYGVFLGEHLIGYCTIGGADDCPDMIEKHEHWSGKSLLLGDVFIQDDYQGQGLGTMLVSIARTLEDPQEELPIFLTLLFDEIGKFYQKLGWQWCDETKEYCMVYLPPHYKKIIPDDKRLSLRRPLFSLKLILSRTCA